MRLFLLFAIVSKSEKKDKTTKSDNYTGSNKEKKLGNNICTKKIHKKQAKRLGTTTFTITNLKNR